MSNNTPNPPFEPAERESSADGPRQVPPPAPQPPSPSRSTEPGSELNRTEPLSTIDQKTAGYGDETIRLQPDSAPDPTIPVSIDRVIAGRYCLERELGRGGFGVVMLAYDRELHRQVAIKIARRTTELKIDSLLEEGRKIAQLDHPNLVPVYDCGYIDQKTVFIVSKYVDGGSLSSQLALRRLSIDEAVSIATQIAEALAHAHERGFIHRDLKPSNIMLDMRNNAHITDFGLAIRTTDRSDHHCVEGSLRYMSPEQASGKSRLVDRRTDVFSFGVILYEMLTGRRPFPGRSSAEYREQVMHDDPVAPSRLVPDVSPCLDQICMKAMAKNPNDRFASAWELAEAIRPCRLAPSPRQRRARLKRWLVPATLLLIAVVLVLGLKSLMGPGAGPPLPERLPRVASSLDREVAEWVLARGGAVDFNSHPATITRLDQLPEPSAALRTVELIGIKPISAQEMADLCALPRLAYLNLGESELSDDDLVLLSRSPGLEMLWVCKNDLTDRGLMQLARLQTLRYLDLERTQLTNAGLPSLARLPNLEHLNLSGTQIHDEGLPPLQNLPKLRRLLLNRTMLTDASIDDLLNFQGLTRLEVRDTRLSTEGMERLQAGLPGCMVVR